MKKLTLKAINAEIARRGGKERLVRGQGRGRYYYFINVGKNEVPGSAICTARLNAITLEGWMQELQLAREEADGQ